MAVQMHIAHSSRVKGVGALAAGPYYCAQGSLWTAMSNCMRPGGWSPLPDINALKAQTERYAREGAIDPRPASSHGARLAFLRHAGRDGRAARWSRR